MVNKNLVLLLVRLEFKRIFFLPKAMAKIRLGMPFGKEKPKSLILAGRPKSKSHTLPFGFLQKRNKLGELISLEISKENANFILGI